MSFVGNLTGVAPDILDNFDTDVAAREYADIMGTSPALVRDIVVRDKIRADRQEAQQQAQQQEQAAQAAQTGVQGAQAAKLLSETDSQNPNALTALLQRGQSRGI
jgi:beta-phosphoglucomutase-like phosphatase (HAD superfamily)